MKTKSDGRSHHGDYQVIDNVISAAILLSVAALLILTSPRLADSARTRTNKDPCSRSETELSGRPAVEQ